MKMTHLDGRPKVVIMRNVSQTGDKLAYKYGTAGQMVYATISKDGTKILKGVYSIDPAFKLTGEWEK